MAPLSWLHQGGGVTVNDERGNRESVKEARERGERCMKTESRGGYQVVNDSDAVSRVGVR